MIPNEGNAPKNMAIITAMFEPTNDEQTLKVKRAIVEALAAETGVRIELRTTERS